MTGRMILHYEVVEKLGEGGMGVVYKARDTHLDRFVAVKMLPAGKVSDPERKRRFIREAKAASALQHANIVTVHDIAESDGCSCIVMEHVEGRTLEAIIPKHGLRAEEAVRIGIQLADALSAAHSKGIVHRDLKPGNVMVRTDGTVKVLDFGLAKLTEPEATGPDAVTRTVTTATAAGTVVGTAPYMSPEQAEGKAVDGRSDIFSFGAVLYEMLSGRRAFQGETSMQVLSAVLNEEPALPADVPRDLARIVMRCLRKDVERRFQSMKDVKVELEDLKQETDSGNAPAAGVKKPGMRRWIVAGAGLIAALTVGVLVWQTTRSRPESATLQLTRFTFDPGQTAHPALSADGKLAAYASDRSGEGHLDIYVQHTSGGQPMRLTRHEAEDYDPSISPDGSKIAFRSERDGGGIYVVDTLGGPERRLVAEGRTPVFSPDGTKIAYFTWTLSDLLDYSPMFVVSSVGGSPRRISPGYVTDNNFRGSGGVFWSPDGNRVLFRGRKLGDPDKIDWWTAPASGGEPVAAGLPPAGPAAFSMAHPVGWFGEHVYYSYGTLVEGMNLFRIPIQRDKWQLADQPEQLTSGGSVIRRISFASDGRVLVSNVTQGIEFWSKPLPRAEAEKAGALSRITSDATIKGHGSISWDGSSLAYVAYVSWQNPRVEIRVRNLLTGAESVFPSKTLPASANPQISPDATKVAYADREDGKEGIYVGPAGNLPGKRVCTGSQVVGFHPDSRRLLVAESAKKLSLLDPDSGRLTTILETGSRSLCYVQFAYVAQASPDGRWLAFSLDSPGGGHPTFIAPLRDAVTPESQWMRLEGSGDNSWSPVWSPDGNTLYMMSNRDGHACVWGQKLDPRTKRPAGSQYAVQHIHRPEASDAVWGRQMFLLSSADKLVVPIASMTGNLWMAKLEGK